MTGKWLLLTGLLLAGAGCARRSSGETGATPGQRGVVVHVVNRYRLSMEVYALGSGINHRLGLVSPGIERDFPLLQALVNSGGVEFTASPSGTGPTVRTGEIRFTPGDTLDFQITTNLVLSHANVRMSPRTP